MIGPKYNVAVDGGMTFQVLMVDDPEDQASDKSGGSIRSRQSRLSRVSGAVSNLSRVSACVPNANSFALQKEEEKNEMIGQPSVMVIPRNPTCDIRIPKKNQVQEMEDSYRMFENPVSKQDGEMVIVQHKSEDHDD